MRFINKNILAIILTLFVTAAITGCAPEVGSEAWCKDMKEKPKGEWTANEIGDFARFCILK